MKFDGKKVNAVCILSIFANVGLTYYGIMPVWVCVVMAELSLIAMAGRSTLKKIENKELRVAPDNGVHRFI